ncbi:MAG: hypothetical protein ACLVJC_01205 [Dorea formicigenerans]
MGAGRTEIMQAIFGNMPHVTGKIIIDGREVQNKSPQQAMKMVLVSLRRIVKWKA